MGVALDGSGDGRRLTFASDPRPPGDPAAAGDAVVYRAPLSLVLAEGPAWHPFTAARLREIGAAALAGLGPLGTTERADPLATRAGLDRLLAAADEAALRLAGAPLPTAAGRSTTCWPTSPPTRRWGSRG